MEPSDGEVHSGDGEISAFRRRGKRLTLSGVLCQIFSLAIVLR
jgi:hypothetical protein